MLVLYLYTQQVNKLFIQFNNQKIFESQIHEVLYLLSFVETPRKFIIAELSIRKLGSSSVLIIMKYCLIITL